jgi:3-deoxy-D-manno-octulosonic-acid transferase
VAGECPRCDQRLTGVLPHPCPSTPALTCHCCHYCYGECEALRPILAEQIARYPGLSFTVAIFRDGGTRKAEMVDYGPLAGQP